MHATNLPLPVRHFGQSKTPLGVVHLRRLDRVVNRWAFMKSELREGRCGGGWSAGKPTITAQALATTSMDATLGKKGRMAKVNSSGLSRKSDHMCLRE